MPSKNEKIRTALASRLKEAREYLSLSQEEVSRMLNIPRSAISLIESADRKVDALELKQFADLYQRPLEFFTGEMQEVAMPRDVMHLARTASKLTAEDREELVRFAQFLESKRKQ